MNGAMSAPDLPPASPNPFDEDLVEAGVYPSATRGAAHGLVILAMGHPYWLVETPEGYRLLIEREFADLARHHLTAYDRESARWPPPPIADPWTPNKTEFI